MEIGDLSEAHLEDRLVNYFGKWFDVYFQERSLCGNHRIDILMFHNSDNSRNYPIGIEIKKGDIKRGTDIGKWCVQAQSYTKALFFEKKPFIFIAPQITGWYLDEGKMVSKHCVEDGGAAARQNNVNSFLYKSFSIGELQKYKTTWPVNKNRFRLVMNTLQVWTSEDPYFLNTETLNKLCPPLLSKYLPTWRGRVNPDANHTILISIPK